MKYTFALTLLVAAATAMPHLHRRAAVDDLVDSFNDLNDNQKANFLQQISADGNVNVQATSNSGSSSRSSSGDVLADVNALALDDGEANVSVNDDSDVALAADVQALDDGKVNVNINGLEDIVVQMAIGARDGAAVNVTLDKGSTASWGEKGGASCGDGFQAKRIIASMGFCVED